MSEDAASQPMPEQPIASESLPASTSPTATGPDGEATAESHDIPMAEHLRAAISTDWDPAPRMPHPAPVGIGASTFRRRAALSARFPDHAIVVPAGRLKTRANDTDYAFRAASAFTWLTGETAEDAVLVMVPRRDHGHRDGGNPGGHDSTLYVAEYAQPGHPGYFTDRRHAGVWVGNVPSVADTAAVLEVVARPRADLREELRRLDLGHTLTTPGVDADVDALLPDAADGGLAQAIDELRLTKDQWEIDRLRFACEATARGFADVARELPLVVGRGDVRGERWLEGTFWRRARLEGNEVGYTSIIGSGSHATTLHWWRNHGVVEPGGLLLADMGIETDELYTADVTRTMPVDGRWTAPQLQVYQAVREAQAAGIGEVKAGADFTAAHKAAMWVLADYLHSWGILPVTAEVSCADDPERPGAGLHRRYTLHSTSHMLGIDVHDCAQARKEMYTGAALAAGHVLTVEPGLYFQPNDRSAPADLRGIGVRIEDDIVVTDGEPENLSAMLPRDPDDLVTWMRDAQATPAVP